MVLHIGFSPFFGDLSIYDTVTKIQSNHKILLVYFNQFNKISLIFDEIKSKIVEIDESPKFGCACILLDHNYKDEFRNILLENCSNFGFKTVEFIDLRSARILDIILQTNFIPKNGDIFAIIDDTKNDYSVFKQNFNNIELVGAWKFNLNNEIEKPNVILILENECLKIDFYQKEFPESEFFGFQKFADYRNGMIIKARMIAGDDEMKKYSIVS